MPKAEMCSEKVPLALHLVGFVDVILAAALPHVTIDEEVAEQILLSSLAEPGSC